MYTHYTDTKVLELIGVDIDSGSNGETFMELVYKHNQYEKYFRIDNEGKIGRVYVDLKVWDI